MVDSEAVSLLGPDRTSHFYGGRLCLGLVNSVFWRRSSAPEEQLESFAAHNAYHFGRIVQLRQMLGSWPPPSGGLTW